MDTGRGRSLSTRMIVTTVALVGVIVALFGAVDSYQTSSLFDLQSRRLEAITHNELRRRGQVQARDLAQAGRTAALAGDVEALRGFVPQLAPPGDPEVAWVLVADRDGVVVAHSDAAANGRPIADPLARKLAAAVAPGEEDRVESPEGRLMLLSRPIEPVEPAGPRLGAVVIAYRLAPIEAQVAAIHADGRRATRQSQRRTALLGLVFVLLGSAVAVFQGLRISRPLARLAWRAEQIARGDLQARAAVDSRDEIGRLGESFNFMADRLAVLLRETADKAVLDKELAVARAIQESLVPADDVIERSGLQVAGWFSPASRVGGDFWTAHDLPGGRLLVLIADVTGHGMPAAMITACAKAACDTARTLAGDQLTVGRLLGAINGAVWETARRKLVMTCFASILDARARTITFANAGHNFPYLVRGGAGEDLQILMARGNPLGDAPEAAWVERTQALAPGDVILWYTDGIVENEGPHGEPLGDKRLRAALRQAVGQPGAPAVDLDARGVRDAVLRQALAFYGDRPRNDDATVVIARVA